MTPAMTNDEYDRSAQYLHLLSLPMWTELRPALTSALADVDPGAGAILELGPGSGIGTETILAAVADAPVFAAEPSAALRTVLLGRLAGLPGGERVTVYPAGAAEVPLPERLAAVVGMHMVGHLRPAERQALWASLAPRLAPGAPVVLNVQPPDTAVEVPRWPPFDVKQGELTYRGTGAAVPSGPDSLRWRMEYATLRGDQVLDEAVAEYDWWVVSADGLAAELTAAGLTARVDGSLVVATA